MSCMSALKKISDEEQGGVYVGVWATSTHPHIPVLLSQLTFFQWILVLDVIYSSHDRWVI
jgi:hypothetical protein